MSKKKKFKFPVHRKKNNLNQENVPIQQPNPNGEKKQETRIIHKEFSGPLPAPEILEHYDRIKPGLAERIIVMTEYQSQHRMGMENKVIDSDIKNSKLGIVFAFLLGMAGIVSCVILGLNGKQITGSVIGGTSLVSLVSAFIYGTKSRKEERERKKEKV